MGDRSQNSPIFKAVQKFCPWFPVSTELATFTMLFQIGSLGDSSLSSRLPIWHFWSSEALTSHICQFHTSSSLKIWVLYGIQSGLICLNISAFSLHLCVKWGRRPLALDKAFNMAVGLTVKAAKILLACAVLGFFSTYWYWWFQTPPLSPRVFYLVL